MGCCGLNFQNERAPPPDSRCLGLNPNQCLQRGMAAVSGAAPASPPSASGIPDAAAVVASEHSVATEQTSVTSDR